MNATVNVPMDITTNPPVPRGWSSVGTSTDETTASVLPIIHQNGTSKSELMTLRCVALHQLRTALDALRDMSPHGRDYYPVPGLLHRAETIHRRRIDAIQEMIDSIEAETLAIDQLP